MTLFESDRDNLTVYSKDEIIAQFQDGKFATDDKKVIKVLRTLDTCEEVNLSGEELTSEDYFDGEKFKKKVTSSTVADDVTNYEGGENEQSM